ncbi:MAG: DEAD/DEAH box helicase [Candidatus Sumerlaeota bacterium]|nr:DEAD/DEAH box helicase [Candidatus Sumerlaeota bacterium]
MSSAEIELIDSETIGVRFPFDPSLVRQIRGLSSRRWNPQEKRWEIHIAHLAEVMRIFYLHPNEAPPEVVDLYRSRWIRKRLRVIVGNTLTRLSGAPIPFDRIDGVTSFPVFGHQYSMKFIDGSWDGRKRLFNRRDLTFPTGLLDAVQGALRAAGADFELVDERKPGQPEFKWRMSAELRPYQKEAVRRAVEAKRGVLEMATGSGKTLVAAKIIARLKRRTMFFVHTKDLLLQTIRLLNENLGDEIGQVGDGAIDLKPITVATIQTAVRAFGGAYGRSLADDEPEEDDTTDLAGRKQALAEAIQSASVVFFDECHHVPAETCYAVAMQTHAADCRFGLSATPYRADRHDMLLEAALGPKIYRANCSRLIDLGYLVPPRIRFVPVPGLSGRPEHADYHEVYRRHVVDNEERHRIIAREAQALNAQGKSALILVNEVQHGEQLLRFIPEARFVQGADDARVRQKALADLEAKRLMTLIATTLADEGLDVPTLDAVILAGGGRSETKALQRIGRALRLAKGKKAAAIIDFFDQAPYLRDHARKRQQIYCAEPRFEVDARVPESRVAP